VNSNAPVSRFTRTYPLDPQDASVTSALRAMATAAKGAPPGIEGRASFDALMERVEPPNDVRVEQGTVGGIPGIWIHPSRARPEEAILHLHAGWFIFGTAGAFRNLVGQLVARVATSAFIPDYRLAPEHPFPAATEDVWECYQGLIGRGHRRIALAGDSAGGNLALGLASRIVAAIPTIAASLVGVALQSPVTDLTLSGESYQTRADADPYFTRAQITQLVHAYLGPADPRDALVSPLYGRLTGLPPICIQVGDNEVLLEDSRRLLELALASGVDARLDVWMGMPHGFVALVGKLKAASLALDAVSEFLSARFTPPSAR